MRGFCACQAKPLAEVVAEAGWFDLELSDLVKIGRVLGFNLDEVTTTVDALLSLTRGVLKCNTSRAMTCIANRLERRVPETDVKVILDIDEAASCLLKDEEKALREQQKASRNNFQAMLQLHNEYANKQRAILSESGPSRPAKKPKTGVVKVPKEGLELLPQKALKRFFPPKCCLWKIRSSGTWNIRKDGWPCSASRSTRYHGEATAIKLLVSLAWYQHGILTGVEYEKLPVQGLLALGEIFDEK